jgi:hypothetical protein
MIWKNWQKFPQKKIKNIQISSRKKNPKIPQFFWVKKEKHFLEKKSLHMDRKTFFSYENLKERVQPWPSRHTEQFFHLQSYLEERIFTHIPHLGLYKSLPHPTKDDA